MSTLNKTLTILFIVLFMQTSFALRPICAVGNTCICEKVKVRGYVANFAGCGFMCAREHSTILVYLDSGMQDYRCAQRRVILPNKYDAHHYWRKSWTPIRPPL